MFDFPSSAWLGQKIPKSAFCEQYSASGHAGVKFPPGLKDQLQTSVEQIVLEYDLQERSTTLKAGKVREIMILTIAFKQQPKNGKLVEFLLKNNPHNILCVVKGPAADDVVAVMAEGNFYAVPYRDQTFHISGRTLDEAWEGLVEQALLLDEPPSSEPLPRRLEKRNRRLNLIDQIAKLEAKKAKEVQPAKKNDLHHLLLPLREELRRLTDSTAQNNEENVR